jgi:hypothetical protein
VVVVDLVPVAVVDPMFATAGVAGLLPQPTASNAKPTSAEAQGVKPMTRRSRAFELVGRLAGMSILLVRAREHPCLRDSEGPVTGR